MIHIKFEDLSAEAQEKLLKNSRKDVERKYRDSIRAYCAKTGADYHELMETETIKNLYAYRYTFSI